MPLTNSISGRFRVAVQSSRFLFSHFGWLFTLVVILLFALALRLVFYTGVLDSDVIEYAYYAYGASQGDFQFTSVPREIQFRLALYLPLALLYFLFGVSEFTTVIYVIVASLFGVIFIYGIARLQASESAGIIAALIWAAFPLNVFLSTLFGPDEILATFTIASVFFLLWGNKVRGKTALLCYLLGVAFAVWGVFVKPSAVIIFIFVGIFFSVKALQYWREALEAWVVKISPSVSRAIAVMGGLLVLVLGLLYFQSQTRPFLVSLFRASTDLAQLFVLGKTQEDVRGQLIRSTPLFLVAAPVFIVAVAGSITNRLRGAALPLLWAAVMFFYYEWGSMSTNLSLYSPFLAVTKDRNVLFLFAPFVVLVGIFFAQWIDVTQARWLAALSLGVILPLAWLQNQAHFAGPVQDFISFTVPLGLIGVFLVPVYLNYRPTKASIVIVWLVILLVAFLYPTPPLHISAEYWQSQIGYRRVIREAIDFFMGHLDYPILVLSGNNADELNFLSGFELGFSAYGVEQPDARIQRVPDPKAWSGSAYIYLRDEINQIQPVPSDWWKVAEYDPGSGRPLLIYRHLSAEDAATELESAKRAIAENQMLADLERLLAAGVNAGDVQASVDAWILLNRKSPEGFSLDLIAPTVIDAFYEKKLSVSENLLAPSLVGGLDTYLVDQALQGSVTYETAGSEANLYILVGKDLGGKFGVYKHVLLEPDSVYIFSVDVHSATGVDLLRVMGGKIQDTHDYSNVYEQWGEQIVMIVTPSWEDDMKVRVDLLTVAKPGFVALKNPRLYQVELEKP